jgi:toxin ParE1/3/4
VTPVIIVQPAAQRDLAEIADYFAERSLKLALRFAREAARAFHQLAAMPEMGGLREFANPGLAGIRVWRLRGFKKYLVYYRARPDGIEVLRVLHAARDIGRILGS